MQWQKNPREEATTVQISATHLSEKWKNRASDTSYSIMCG